MVKRYGVKTILAVAITVALWSTTFAGMVAALGHFSPHHLLFLRWTLTSVLFVVAGVVTGVRLPRAKDLPLIALAGVLGFSGYQLLLVNGQAGVSATMAGFLTNLNPVFTTVIGVALGKERGRWNTWAGIAVCTFGLLVMAQGKGGFGQVGPSAGLVVLAALSFASYTLVAKPLMSTYRPLEVTTYALIAGSLPFLIFAPGSMHALTSAPASAVANLVYLAVLPGGVAYVLWSYVVHKMAPGVAARFLYLIPVIGVPVAWVWVGEAPRAVTVAGGLLIIAGVALASARLGLPRLRVAHGATVATDAGLPEAA